MRYTAEEIAAAGQRAERELSEQQLTLGVTDPAGLRPLLRWLEAPVDVHAVSVEVRLPADAAR